MAINGLDINENYIYLFKTLRNFLQHNNQKYC